MASGPSGFSPHGATYAHGQQPGVKDQVRLSSDERDERSTLNRALPSVGNSN